MAEGLYAEGPLPEGPLAWGLLEGGLPADGSQMQGSPAKRPQAEEVEESEVADVEVVGRAHQPVFHPCSLLWGISRHRASGKLDHCRVSRERQYTASRFTHHRSSRTDHVCQLGHMEVSGNVVYRVQYLRLNSSAKMQVQLRLQTEPAVVKDGLPKNANVEVL